MDVEDSVPFGMLITYFNFMRRREKIEADATSLKVGGGSISIFALFGYA